MQLASADFRSTFASDAIRETVRAFGIFTVLLLAILAIAGELALRDLSLAVLRERMDLGRAAALEIVRDVAALDGPGSLPDFRRLHAGRDELAGMIALHIAERPFLRKVEIRDRYGVRVVLVDDGVAEGRPSTDSQLISVPLAADGRRGGGEIRLGISQSALDRELLDLRRSLWIKIAVAGALALLVLVLGLLYVLRLIRKNRELERSREAAQRAAYVGLLASGLAHEIRNPLNAMNMNLQMLEEELQTVPLALPAERAELLDSTKIEIRRLERLVRDFLAYARPPGTRLKRRDLNDMVREIVRLLQADARGRGVTIETDLAEPFEPIAIDESQIKQALINLVVNARQVQPGGGRVVVRTRPGDCGEAIIEVEDDGPGVRHEDLDQIFDVFFSRRSGGTGLGLPIARQIVERHGGTIDVDSRPGRGAVFRITLPREREAT